MTASNDGDGLDMPRESHRITLATMNDEFAAKITITDLGADASPVIIEEVVESVLGEVEHLVVDHEVNQRD